MKKKKPYIKVTVESVISDCFEGAGQVIEESAIFKFEDETIEEVVTRLLKKKTTNWRKLKKWCKTIIKTPESLKKWKKLLK